MRRKEQIKEFKWMWSKWNGKIPTSIEYLHQLKEYIERSKQWKSGRKCYFKKNITQNN